MMEENLSNSQAVLGISPDAMHNAFKSDEEMLIFYLTLNRFINHSSSELFDKKTGGRRSDEGKIINSLPKVQRRTEKGKALLK